MNASLVIYFLSGLPFSVAEELKPWEKLYEGEEAAGENVLGLWQFLPGKELEDSSGNGHKLALRGESRIMKEGKFGSCLESFISGKDKDNKAQGATVRDHPSLTPKGAFTIELWIKVKSEIFEECPAFLIDKKYYHYVNDLPQANHDYCLFIDRAGPKQLKLVAFLGFGKDSAWYESQPISLEADKWHYVAFAYNGIGMGRHYLDGKMIGRSVYPGRGAISHYTYPLCIGGRVGSTHVGFPGFIDQVRITNGIPKHLLCGVGADASTGRTVFRRMEKGAALAVTLYNDSGKHITSGTVRLELGGAQRVESFPEIETAGSRVIRLPVDTSLRPDKYELKVTVFAQSDNQTFSSHQFLPISIMARPLPHPMPVVLWGGGDLLRMKEIGFTHSLINPIDYHRVWTAGKAIEAWSPQTAEQLEEFLANDFGGLAYLYPASWFGHSEKLSQEFQRIDRGGQRYNNENVCGLFPEIQQFCYNVGASVAETYGNYPALQGSLIHSEVRDATELCFHLHDLKAFRDFAGFDLPSELTGKTGFPYTRIKDFPLHRTVPDDHPFLIFYRWFWAKGDGWNILHSKVHQGLHSTGRNDLWTFFDPAVRAPSIWGSGGDVEVISQWTYSYPDPLKMGQSTDEMFCMAEGRPGQQVMKMTQVIWYRQGTAPKLPEDESKYAPWEKEEPSALFITISPDHLREAFWCKIARPIKGIMYHGWSSLVEVPGNTHAYRFTNPQTQEVLAKLIREVVRPLGPVLLQVPDRNADVAILESFASQMFAGRGTWGWSHQWEADLHLVLQYAQLQPRILFDESIVRDGLGDYKVLFMPHCDVLTESVARKVIEFQNRGGLVVADEYLAPAITPDILIRSTKRTDNPQEDKAVLQARAADLRKELDEFYDRYGESSNPDVVVRLRRYGTTDYLFAINDHRAYGDYVGHHRKVMEKGLPSNAFLMVSRPKGYVYNLVTHKEVETTSTRGKLHFDSSFGPGEGHLYMITERPVRKIVVEALKQAKLGGQVKLDIDVVSSWGREIQAIVPVHLEIVDPLGRQAEGSGNYGAKDGELNVILDLAGNDLPGTWTVRAMELASGRKTERSFEVWH